MSQDKMIEEAAVLIGANIIVERCRGVSRMEAVKKKHVHLTDIGFSVNETIAIVKTAINMVNG